MFDFDKNFEADILELVAGGDLQGLEDKVHRARKSIALISEFEFFKIMRNKFNAMRDLAGNSLLHMAVNARSVETLLWLFKFNLNPNVLDAQGFTPLALADSLPAQDLVAALKIKNNLNESLPNFNLSLTATLIDNILESIKPADGQNKVLFIGPSSAGKSTLLNYLNGTSYEIYYSGSGRICARPISGLPEIAQTGEKPFESQTLYPQIVKKDHLDFAYCDLAGLFDSGKKEEKICAAVSAMLLSKSTGDIQGIMVVLDMLAFQSLNAKSFKNTAQALALLVNKDHELMDNVCFVITKLTPDGPEIKVADFIERYVSRLIHELSDTDKDFELLFMLRAMSARANKIIFADIGPRGNCRLKIEQVIQGFKKQQAVKYSFNNFDESQREFNAVLLQIAGGFLDKNAKIEEKYPNALAQLQDCNKILDDKITEYRQTIADLESERQMQDKLDNIVATWAQITELQPKTNNLHQAQATILLQDTSRWLAEIKNCPANILPQQLDWLPTITSRKPNERTDFLREQLATRRWCLPWAEDANNMSGGPKVLLNKGIAKLETLINEIQGNIQKVQASQATCRQLLADLKLELKVLQNIYEITYKIIKALGYDLGDYLYFQEEYAVYAPSFINNLMQAQPLPVMYTRRQAEAAAAVEINQEAALNNGVNAQYKI